jgi:hypothetical protein
MKSVHRRLIAAALMLVLAIFASCEEKNKEAAGNKTKVQLSGYTVTISEEVQKTGGIMTKTLSRGFYQKHVEAYGEVLSPEGLSESYKSYITAKSGLEKAKARLTASQQEYERLKVLNANGKNVSDRVLQAAAAQLADDKAEEANAQGSMQSVKNDISIAWGPVVSDWIFSYNAPFEEVVATRVVLVRLAVPSAAPLQSIPKQVLIKLPSGASIPARFISRATSTSRSIQGMSFLYIASSRSGSLLPGMNVTAQMLSAETQSGFFVPTSAVVWLQDKAWVYIKKSETGFSRVEVPVSSQTNKGFFVSGVFSARDQIVINGAQALLSEEIAPETTRRGGGEEGDED